MDQKSQSILIAAISLVLGICFNWLFFDKALGIGFFVFIFLILVGLWVSQRAQGLSVDRQVHWLAIPILFFSFMIAVRGSLTLTALNMIAVLALLALVVAVSVGRRIKEFRIKNYLERLISPLVFIPPFFGALSDIFSSSTPTEENKTAKQVLKGIAMAIPALVVFVLLFSSADMVFKKYVTNLVDIRIDDRIIVRSILVVIVAAFFVGAYSFIQRRRDLASLPEFGKRLSFTSIEASVFLGVIGLLFLVFIVIQLAYLFGGESNISEAAFTYAEYARKGFFELIVVAVISFLILYKTEDLVERNENEHFPLFKFASAFLILEVLVIVASAWKRLALYESAYGFTVLRLNSHIFIIWLAILFLLLLYKLFTNGKPQALAFQIFLSMIVFLFGLNILNPDKFIAEKNLEMARSGNKIDASYLNSLSDDAIEEKFQALEFATEPEAGASKDLANEEGISVTQTLPKNHKKILINSLEWRKKRFELLYYSTWSSWNLSRANAKKVLENNKELIERYKREGL